MNSRDSAWDAIIVGGGCAGLSAAIYLSRSRRRVLVVDAERSLANMAPDVENYLGFPKGIRGKELLRRGRSQARRFGAAFETDFISEGRKVAGAFCLAGRETLYHTRRVIVATGILHVPPNIPDIGKCIGRGVYFCKDCDGLRAQGKKAGVIGASNTTAEFALGLRYYTTDLFLATNGEKPGWDREHRQWLAANNLPVVTSPIVAVKHGEDCLCWLEFEDGTKREVAAVFTSRGDTVRNGLARSLDLDMDHEGFIKVDEDMRTSMPGVYSVGCVTPANCQMIIAAGTGATAAQAVHRDLFEEELRAGGLPKPQSNKASIAPASSVGRARKAPCLSGSFH